MKTQAHMLALLLALGFLACTGISPSAQGADDDAKAKADGKDKKEKDEQPWEHLYTVSNEPGGFKQFDVAKNSKVKFTWETTPDGQVPQFRVTVAKLNDRTGSYQTLGTVVSTNKAAKGNAGMVLASGKYRLYVATKFMKYTLNVEGQSLK